MSKNIPDWILAEADEQKISPIACQKAEFILAQLQRLKAEKLQNEYNHPLCSTTIEELQEAAARYILHSEEPPASLGINPSEMSVLFDKAEADIAQRSHFLDNLGASMVASKRYGVAQFQKFIEKRLQDLGNPNDPHHEWKPDTLSDAVYRFTTAYANKFGRPLFAKKGGLNLVGDQNIKQTETPLDDIIKQPLPRPPITLSKEIRGDDGKTYTISNANPDYDYDYYDNIPHTGGLSEAESKALQHLTRNFHFGAADNYRGRVERLEKFAAEILGKELPNDMSDDAKRKAEEKNTKKTKAVSSYEWSLQTGFDGLHSNIDPADITLHNQLMPEFEAREKHRQDFLKFVDDKIAAVTAEQEENPPILHDIKRIMELAISNRNIVMRLYDKPLQLAEEGPHKHDWSLFKSIFEEYNALHPEAPAPMPEPEPEKPNAGDKPWGERFGKALRQSFSTPHV